MGSTNIKRFMGMLSDIFEIEDKCCECESPLVLFDMKNEALKGYHWKQCLHCNVMYFYSGDINEDRDTRKGK